MDHMNKTNKKSFKNKPTLNSAIAVIKCRFVKNKKAPTSGALE